MSTTSRVGELTLSPKPRIEAVSVRRFDDLTDYEALAALMRLANTEDAIPYLPTAQNLEVEMRNSTGIVPADDVVVVELDGRLIASSVVERNMRDGVPTYELSGTVDPTHRRLGIGTSLMASALGHARARANREDPDRDVKVGAFAEETEVGHQALLLAAGMLPVRHFFLMRRSDLATIPDVPLPDGFEIRPVSEDQWRTIFDAESEAFRDHWGHREMDDNDFQMTFTMPELDTDLWVAAWAGDDVAGVVQNWIWPEENERLGVKRGWLEHISVRRPWRRRGLARAITAAALVKIREAGMDDAMLGVDSENPNGALGLYEGLGFIVQSRGAAYNRILDR
ncbi:MAG: GNAT family N-acetyltransferase [Chloroflexi bacterium]|nr:GNAT family N-acetyltransferase [Chloroflexota bacterium]